ncbi:peptidoglycan-binding protein [Inquilinus sp. CA228]|uniref:peptidoglycan-binding domain-containing protein n=1 Tax=Inquilinus sp. CA228 TaxID=3455609 RepID=UPI003F8D49B9
MDNALDPKMLPRVLLFIAAVAVGIFCAAQSAVFAQGVEHRFSQSERSDAFRAISTDMRDGLVAVGGRDSDGQDGAKAIVYREDTIGHVALELDISQQNAVSTTLVALLRLAEGDYVASGWVRLHEVEFDDCFVVRFRTDGQIVWKINLGGPGHERCYFAVRGATGDLIVGGRRERKEEARQPARGVYWHLNPETGAALDPSGREVGATGGRRSAFQSAVALMDGGAVFAGWVTDDTRHADDAWAISVRPDGTTHWEWRDGGVGMNLANAVIARSDGGVLIFGYGTRQDGSTTSGLVAAVGREGKTDWLKFVDAGDIGDDKFFSGVVMDSGQIIAVGGTKEKSERSEHGWIAQLGQDGAVLTSRVFDDVAESRLYSAGVTADQRLLAAGVGERPGGKGRNGWIVTLEPAWPDLRTPKAMVSTSTDLGKLQAGTKGIKVTKTLAPGGAERYSFEIITPQRVEAVLLPVDGDSDLALMPSDDAVPISSNNSGEAAELIEATLPPGRHMIEAVGPAESPSKFHLILRARPAASPSSDAISLEATWEEDERKLVEHGLELLGYDPGDPDGIFTGATRSAVRAFQERSGVPATGWLSERDRFGLAFAAGNAAAALGDAAALRATRAAEAPDAVKQSNSDNDTWFNGEFGPGIVHAISRTARGWTYRGQWQERIPNGMGALADGDREWIGEIVEGSMQGYGVFRSRGKTLYAGEWGRRGKGFGHMGYGVNLANKAPVAEIWSEGEVPDRSIPY